MTGNIATKRKTCRGCGGGNLRMFLNLGRMPLAGGYLNKGSRGKERRFPLKVYFCPNCGLVQILDVINPQILFKKYYYISSVIKSMDEHFQKYYVYLKKKYLNRKNASLLEFGSNDGVLLKYFLKDKDIKAVGVDPSENVTKMAKKIGCDVHLGYFNTQTALSLYKKYGKFDVVTGSNVFAHTDNIDEILYAADLLLKEGGHFIIEVHYLLDLIEKFQFDTVYHEHLSYYSLTSLKNIFAQYGFKLIDVVHLEMHGGGIRAVAVRSTTKTKESPELKKYLRKEKELTTLRLLKFQEKVDRQREKIRKLMRQLKRQHKKVVGYGAAGRGTILLNYCGIDRKHLKYVVDVSPLRQGKLMPGVRIPIYPLEKLRKRPSDYVLVIAWNYFDSILSQEKELMRRGVKFIKPLPEVSIV